MRKLNKLALSVALAASTSIAAAGDIAGPATPVNFGAELSVLGEQALVLDKGAIVIEIDRLYRANDELTLSLTGGAEFAETGFLLFGSDAASTAAQLDDSSDWLFGEATSTSVTFIALNALTQGDIFYLSSSTGTDLDEVELDVLAGAAGTSAVISAVHTPDSGSGADTYTTPAELFGYVREFTAAVSAVSGAFTAVIDAENAGRLEFVGNGSDAINLSFSDAGLQTDILGIAQDVVITLSGDMRGIGSVLLQEGVGGGTAVGTIDVDSLTATVRASAIDVFDDGLNVDSILEITPFGTLNEASGVVMAPRTFTVSASLEVGNSSTSLINNVAAGGLTTNGASARIAQMSLGFGFVQWVKVVNLGAEAAPITADITVDGETYPNVDLGVTVAGESVATISGADIEAALAAAGGPDVGSLVDASVLINVPLNQDSVEFHSEKKGTDGRTITNVITGQ